MLPLLRDELNIVLAPQRATLQHYSRAPGWRGVRRQLLQTASVRSALPVAAAMPWDGVLRALSSELPLLLRGKAEVRVILSSHFVRYALLPWSDALSDAAEEELYARHYFRELYGAEAAQWEVRISPAGIALPQMASAVEGRLLQDLRQLLAQHGLVLKSIQPALMAAYNSCRAQLAQASGWLVIHEAGCLCIALLQEGQWRSVRTLRSADDWLHSLPRLLERETYLAEASAATCEQLFLWAPALQDAMPATAGRWNIQPLQQVQHNTHIPDPMAHFASGWCESGAGE